MATAPGFTDVPSAVEAAAPTPTPPSGYPGTGSEFADTLNQLNNTQVSSLVLARRMASLQRQNPAITASLAFDIAAGVNDTTSNTTQLDASIPSYAQPNALSVLVHNAANQQAALGAVTDIATYQQNLQAAGYLPSGGYTPGIWDQPSQNASYQSVSDTTAQINQGKGRLLSMTAGDGLKLLNATMPSGIWHTLVGMGHGLVQSMTNTAKDAFFGVTGVVERKSAQQINAEIKASTGRDFSLAAMGEDVANVFTIAALATGLGELGAVLKGANALGDVAAERVAAGGAQSLLGALIKPVPGESGVLARSLGTLVSKVGGDEAYGTITDLAGKYGPKAIERTPIMQVVGRGYGALRWITLPQAALSTFEPHSLVAREAQQAKAPWWIDVPLMVGVAGPVGETGKPEGIISTGKRLLGVNRIVDAYTGRIEKIVGDTEMWPQGKYTQVMGGAYMKAILNGDAELSNPLYAGIGARDTAAWRKALGAGEDVFRDHAANEMARLVNRVVENPTDPTARRVSTEFAQAAQEWADRNQHAGAEHYVRMVMDARTRQEMGLQGLGEWDQYERGSAMAYELNHLLPAETLAQAGGAPAQGDLSFRQPAELTAQAQLFEPRPLPAPGEQPALTGAAPRGRVMAMRADNPETQQNLERLAREWDTAVNGIWTPGKERVMVQPPDLARQAELEREIVKVTGMEARPKDQWTAALLRAAKNAPRDLTDFLSAPELAYASAAVWDATQLDRLRAGRDFADRSWRLGQSLYGKRLGPLTNTEKALAQEYRDWVASQVSEGLPTGLPAEPGSGRIVPALDLRAHAEGLNELGYKAVLGGWGDLTPEDWGPMMMHAPKMKFGEYALSSLGLSPTPNDVTGLVHATQMHRAAENLSEINPELGYGTGQRMMQSVFRAYGNVVADRTKIVGEGATKVQRMVDRLARTVQVSQGPSQAFIRSVLEGPEWNLSGVEARAASRALYQGLKDGAAAPGLVTKPSGMLAALHTVAAGMRVHGFPGVVDALKAFTLSDVPILGGALSDNYGRLFETPLKWASALRFQLNPMFEMRKLTKGEALAGELESIPPSLRPYRALLREDPMGRLNGARMVPTDEAATAGLMRYPYGDAPAGGVPSTQRVQMPTGYDVQAGGRLIDRYSQIFTRTQGQDVSGVNDLERAFSSSGVFGYNMQHHAILDVGRIWDKVYSQALAMGKGVDEATSIADTYAAAHGPSLYTFGGRSPLAKSAHLLFFPFSFESKIAGTAAEYLTSEPMRLLLAHEMARRFQQWDTTSPGQRSRFAEIVRKYAPVLGDVAKLNPFAHGIGPGEFLGIYRPIYEALQLPADAVIGAMSPGVIPADKVAHWNNIKDRVLPGLKATAQFFKDLNEQKDIILSPRHVSNRAQIDAYYPVKDGWATQYGEMGRAFGTQGSIAEFQQSSKVPVFLKQEYRTKLAQLQAMYPAAARHEALATNTNAVHQNDIEAILNKVTRTPAEQAVTQLEAARLQMQSVYTLAQKSTIMKHLVQDTETQVLRAAAVRAWESMGASDQQDFNTLWIKLGYEHTYGPLAIPLQGGRNIGAAA